MRSLGVWLGPGGREGKGTPGGDAMGEAGPRCKCREFQDRPRFPRADPRTGCIRVSKELWPHRCPALHLPTEPQLWGAPENQARNCCCYRWQQCPGHCTGRGACPAWGQPALSPCWVGLGDHQWLCLRT